MADQLLKVREKVQEKLKKEAEVVVEIEQPSALQSATVDYLSKKEKPHPLSSPKNLNEEQLDEFKKASVEFDRRNKSDMMKAKKDLEKKGHKVDVSGSMITVTAKRGSDIGREIKDVMNFYNGAKRAKALESVNEGKMSQLHMYIKQGKTAKEIGKLMGVDPKTIQKLMSAYDAKKIKEEMKIEAAIDEAKLIEREKSVRQLIDPNKESMVMKKNKVIVIDKKDEDKYLKKGWALAEAKLIEKVSYVEYKFKNARDAEAAKKYFDAQQRMSFDVNDDNMRGGELMVDAGKNDMTKFHKEVMKKFRPKVMSSEEVVKEQSNGTKGE